MGATSFPVCGGARGALWAPERGRGRFHPGLGPLPPILFWSRAGGQQGKLPPLEGGAPVPLLLSKDSVLEDQGAIYKGTGCTRIPCIHG